MNCSFANCSFKGQVYLAEMAKRAAAVCTALLLFVTLGHAQASLGRISGVITDQTGGTMAGVMVTVLDTQRGIARTLTTDESGEYVAPNLTPSSYTVNAEAKGFKTAERSGILLETGKDLRVDLALQPGEQAQKIVVTEEMPLVETTNATLGGTLSNQSINDLPLNGRNYQNLLSMRPGVLVEPGGGSWTQSTNGVRPEDNVYLVNGMYNVGAFSALSILNAPALAGDAASILPIDAIQEFNTEENPRAEYGWKPGAVINVGIKSGTNGLHGTAYAFGRDTAFDARNFFNEASEPGCPAPCAKTGVALEQYGATVGGPIKKDRIFFFGGYEGQRYTVGSPFQATEPVSVSLGGNPVLSIPDAVAGINAQCALQHSAVAYCTSFGVGGTANLSALSQHLLNTIWPTTSIASTTNPGIVSANFPSTFASDNWLAKVDFHINEKNTLSAMYFIANSVVHDEDAAYLSPTFLTQQTQRPEVGNMNWTWIPNSRWVNEAQFGAQYLLKPSFVGDHTVDPTTYGLNTGVTNPLYFGLPQISINGNNTTFTTLGGGTWPKIQGPETDYIIQDHVSYLMGKHAFKFGGEIVDNSFTGGALNTSRGFIRFGAGTAFTGATALEDFLLGYPNQGKILLGNAERNITNQGYAVFFQDDWRIKPRLVLNLGVRYEINTVIKDANDQLGNFLPATGLVQVGSGINSPYGGDHNNVAPRFGLAWDIFGNGKTVFRAGAAVVYEQLSYNVFLAYSNTLGLGTVPTGAIIGTPGNTQPGPGNIAVGSFTFTGKAFSGSPVNWNGSSVGGSTIFPTGAVNCAVSPCNTVAVDPNLRSPFVTTWTAEIQRSITNDLSLEVGYVGDHGSKLIGFHDMNQLNPATNLRPFSNQYPYLAFIYQISNQDYSNYDSLQATLTKRTSHGLSFTGGYTYAHALDIASANFGGGIPQNSNAPQLEYGDSNFDIRHRFTFTTTYAIPGRKGFGQALEGWQINSILSVQTAQPWSAVDTSSNISGTGENVDRWDFVGKPSDFTAGPNPIPFFLPGNPPAGDASDPAYAKNNALCTAATGSNTGLQSSMSTLGCFAQGSSVLIPPVAGTFGTAGRNIFRGRGLKNWDLSVTKGWAWRETMKAEFRAEFFNVLNHPNFGTPGVNGSGFNNPNGSQFGCTCETPDTAASNPVLGSGGSRAMQLGLKLIF
ncbi:MAG TPA: TonB-dependent receptor [Candidatus Saccharimonadales bacterium]|nr:TonB-dependent receptor [Candidatus Saccharimonadales bacterium]